MDDKEKPLLTVKSVFVSPLIMWQALPWILGGTLALTAVGGTMLWLLCVLLGLGKIVSPGTPYFLCFVAGLAGIAPLYYEMRRRIAQKAFCRFYADYLEYEVFGPFFRHHAGRVFYRDIADMRQRANVLQQRYGLKTIYLAVPGLDWSDRGFSGLKIEDVPSGKGTGKRIQTLLDHAHNVTPAPAWVAPAAPVATGA